MILLRNGFSAAFASLRDKVLLGLVLAISGAWMNAVRSGLSRFEWPHVAAAMLIFGISVHAQLARRLDDLAANSPVAADALQAGARRRYIAAWHLIAIAAAIKASTLIGQTRLALALPAYGVGALLAVLWRTAPQLRFISRARPDPGDKSASVKPGAQGSWASMTLSVAMRQIGIPSGPVRLLAALSAAALIATFVGGVVQHAATQPVAQAVFGLVGIGLAAWLSRVDYAIVRFATFAGYSSWASVTAHSAAWIIESLILTALVSFVSLSFAVISLLITAGAFLVLTLRVLAYRVYPKRQADLVLTLTFGALILVGSGAPFLVPPMLVGLMIVLAWRARSVTWLAL